MENKDIKYLNNNFVDYRNILVDFAKTYFPTTYNDFTPASPGMLFIEMSSYIGDVMSFYLNNQIQENFIQHARQESNLYNLSYMFGYKPKITTVSSTYVDVYQQLPSKTSGSVIVPDFSYCLKIEEPFQLSTSTSDSTPFIIQDGIDFSYSSSYDPTEITVYTVVGNQPDRFLLKKKRKVISSTVKTKNFSFNSPEQFPTVEITDNNIVGILDVVDSDGNIWYEVDYLAQDVTFDSIKNTNFNDPNFYLDQNDTPYLLKLKQVDRRFITRFKNRNTLQIQFGSGITANIDEEIIPNPNNVGLGLPFEQNKLTTAYSPTNFLFTDSYGIAPSNTTLTVRYLTGGGVTSNAESNTITSFSDLSKIKFLNNNLNPTLAQSIFDSLAFNNPEAASGGSDGDSVEEIKQNTMAQYQSQLRTVTEQDYLVRAMSLPSKFGAIAKVFTTSKKISEYYEGEKNTSLDLYVLAFDQNKNLKTPSETLKNNLKTYLSQYRIINDTIDIKDGYIINIGVDFEIITLPNYNSNEVIIKCIEALKDYFNIDKWQINQPILLRNIYVLLDKIEGVQTVKKVTVNNKAGVALGYSEYGYDIEGATINNVVYPSIDPSIFEVKYPDTDIKGRVVNF